MSYIIVIDLDPHDNKSWSRLPVNTKLGYGSLSEPWNRTLEKIIHGTGTVPGQTSDADPCLDKYQRQNTDFRSTIVILKIKPIFL